MLEANSRAAQFSLAQVEYCQVAAATTADECALRGCIEHAGAALGVRGAGGNEALRRGEQCVPDAETVGAMGWSE